MLIRRIIDQTRKQDWTALLSELIIVVLGIFIAIQVDSWWQGQKDLRQEQIVIARLIDDLESDRAALSKSIEVAEFRRDFGDLLMGIAIDPPSARLRPGEFLAAIDQAAYTHTPAVNSDTFEELRSTGNLDLLRSATLRSALFRYYQTEETSRQWTELFLKVEFEHFRLASGILANDLHVWAQDNIHNIGPNNPSIPNVPDELMPGVLQAAERLRDETEFVEYLPRPRQTQLDLIFMHSERKELAEEILALLGSEE